MELLRERTVSAGMLGNSTITGSCNHSPYFREDIIIAQLVVYAVCLISLLLVTGFWAWTSKRKPGVREALPGWSYGGTLLLSTIFYVMAIVATVLTSCSITTTKETAILVIVSTLFLRLAELALLAVVLLPYTMYLLDRAGQKTRFVKIANISVLSAVAFFLPPYMVFTSLSNLAPWIRPSLVPDIHVNLALSAAFTCLLLFASAFGGALLLFALIKAVGDVALSSSVKMWALFTIVSLVLSNLAVVIDVIVWELPQRNLPPSGFIIITTLGNFFGLTTFVGLLMTVSNSEVPPYDPSDDATYDPEDNEQMVNRRFTYTGKGEFETQSRRYSRHRYSIPQDDSLSKRPSVSQTSSSGYRGSLT